MSPIKYRVMIVDDEEDMRTILRVALSQKYEVFEASNGLDAMLKLEKYQPDVAVIDMMMPLMDGYELAEKIRSTKSYEDMPVVALSALNSREDIKKGYTAGANIYLTKPFRPERVDKNITVVLNGRAPRSKSIAIDEILKREKELEESRARAKRKDKTGSGVRVSGRTREEVKASFASGADQASSTITEAPPEPKRPVDTEPVPAATKKAGRPRIFLVDDDEDFLLIGRTTLEADFEVVTATNGVDCMNKIALVEPDLFVLDGMMPKMSGYQLLDLLHGAGETSSIPVIFASAKKDPRDQKHVMSKGVVKYLVKPFSDAVLLETVRNVTAQPGFVVRDKHKDISEVLYVEGKNRASHTDGSEARKRWNTIGKFNEALKDKNKK